MFKFIFFLLTFFLSVQCGNDGQNNIAVPTKSLETPIKNDITKKTTCDFSAYKPAKQSHFLQQAIKKIAPKYPPEAYNNIEGLVYVHILVNRDGDVEQVCCSGKTNELLKQVAEETAKEWKFKRYFGGEYAPPNTYREDTIILAL